LILECGVARGESDTESFGSEHKSGIYNSVFEGVSPDAGRVGLLDEGDGDALEEVCTEPGDGVILNPDVGVFVDSLDAVSGALEDGEQWEADVSCRGGFN